MACWLLKTYNVVRLKIGVCKYFVSKHEDIGDALAFGGQKTITIQKGGNNG